MDDNASDLFDIHKYCLEDLKCDTHGFQFLKGSPILGCDFMYQFDDIFKKSKAYQYKKWNQIKKQLNLVKKYNFEKVFIFNSSVRYNLISKLAGIKKIYQY